MAVPMAIQVSFSAHHSAVPSPRIHANSPMNQVIPGMDWALGVVPCMVTIPVWAKRMPLLI